MRHPRWLYLLTFCLLPQSYLSAQGNRDIKSGKITAAEFNLVAEGFDSSVKSVLISNTGSASFGENDAPGFRRIYNCHKKGGSERIFFKMKSRS